MVRARGLRKIYPARRGAAAFVAVHGIDFEVRRGETFGFLGPNGAGKSSTMRMIGCVSPLSGGSLHILGLDASSQGADIRARLGSVPQDDALDNELTVRENLVVYGRFFGLDRNLVRRRTDALLEFARLADKAQARVAELSGGMRRRLTIARSLINSPELLLLDEPTTGLDPQARHLLWERLFQLKQDGVTLILTTHYMDEAEQLCDRLLIMDGGRIVAEGSPRALIERNATREVLELRFPPRRAGSRCEPGGRNRRADRRASGSPALLRERRRRGAQCCSPAGTPAGHDTGAPLEPRGCLPGAHRPLP